jgi:hypothetical protein
MNIGHDATRKGQLMDAPFAGRLDEEEAQEVADAAKDAVTFQRGSLEQVWAVERAVLKQFGFKPEDDE